MAIGAIIAYLLQSALFLAAGYVFYKLFLAGIKLPAFNRSVILAIYAISLTAPAVIHRPQLLLHSPERSAQTASTFGLANQHPTEINGHIQPDGHTAAMISIDTPSDQQHISWFWHTACTIALAGTIVAMLNALAAIGMLAKLSIHSKRMKLGHIWLMLMEQRQTSPFSLLNMIFLSRHDLKDGGDMIIKHEMGHIRHLHTIDLLLSKICLMAMWWNPAAWLLNRELRTVHEYQADEQVLRNGHEIKEYQLLLIKKAAGTRLPSIASSLNHSKLKQRFTMMYKKRSSRWASLRAIALIPAFCGVTLLTGQPTFASLIEEVADIHLSDKDTNVPTKDSANKDTQNIVAVQPVYSEVSMDADSTSNTRQPAPDSATRQFNKMQKQIATPSYDTKMIISINGHTDTVSGSNRDLSPEERIRIDTELQQAHKEIDEAKEQLEEAKKQLSASHLQLENAQKELDEFREAFDSDKKEFEKLKAELEEIRHKDTSSTRSESDQATTQTENTVPDSKRK